MLRIPSNGQPFSLKISIAILHSSGVASSGKFSPFAASAHSSLAKVFSPWSLPGCVNRFVIIVVGVRREVAEDGSGGMLDVVLGLVGVDIVVCVESKLLGLAVVVAIGMGLGVIAAVPVVAVELVAVVVEVAVVVVLLA